MERKWPMLFVGIASVLLLAGCAPATETRGGGGGCPGGATEQVTLINPANWWVDDSLTPTLHWKYPDASCVPDSYVIHLHSGPWFSDNIGGTSMVDSWTPTTPLQPGREYTWSVEPVVGATTGPSSDEHHFYTGPYCQYSDLVAPVLMEPVNNAVLSEMIPTLLWDYPGGCLPQGFHIQIALSPNFYFQVDDPNLQNIDTVTPSSNWAVNLADCNRFYWRVAPLVDGEIGPYSKTYTLRIAFSGGCPAETKGIVQGTIWQDQCAIPEGGTPVPDPLPLGCVRLPDDSIFTNQSYDPGEPGIPGVTLAIYGDACHNGNPVWVTKTAPDGTFIFYEIPPGEFCILIQTDPVISPQNADVLLPGTWTYPVYNVGQVVAGQNFTVNAGQVVNNIDFGWWYKYSTEWGSTDALVYGMVWHDLCAYTPGDPIPDPIPEGCGIFNGVMHANGVREMDEPPIPGVVVDIGPGDCPSSGQATAVTNVNGYYHFDNLPPGKYCLRVDSSHNPTNAAILLPGMWTKEPSGHEGMTFKAITLTAGLTLAHQDFGWDYDNLPPAATLVPTATATLVAPLTFTPDFNAYCRFGPDPSFDSNDVAMKGQAYLMDGRNMDGSWFRIMLTAQKGCWVPASAGIPSDDPMKLRVLAAIPTYTPTPVPTSTFTPSPTLVVNCSLYTDEKSCELQPACVWVAPAGVPPSCTSK